MSNTNQDNSTTDDELSTLLTQPSWSFDHLNRDAPSSVDATATEGDNYADSVAEISESSDTSTSDDSIIDSLALIRLQKLKFPYSPPWSSSDYSSSQPSINGSSDLHLRDNDFDKLPYELLFTHIGQYLTLSDRLALRRTNKKLSRIFAYTLGKDLTRKAIIGDTASVAVRPEHMGNFEALSRSLRYRDNIKHLVVDLMSFQPLPYPHRQFTNDRHSIRPIRYAEYDAEKSEAQIERLSGWQHSEVLYHLTKNMEYFLRSFKNIETISFTDAFPEAYYTTGPMVSCTSSSC